MKGVIAGMGLALGALGPSVAAAQDAALGEALYRDVCRNCHGPTAKGMASFPRLAGRDEAQLATLLERYRAGETVGPNTPLMRPHAEGLSDAEIAALAHHIATAFP